MKYFSGIVTFFLTLSFASYGFSHCEIPCGIYDDQARIQAIAEDASTIEKSMLQINELSAAGEKNYNQIVRWVNNKEEHAHKIQEIASQYFMYQRIKPAEPSDEAGYQKYVKELTLMHQIAVQAMKAKQTTDVSHVEEIRSLLSQFEASYMGETEKAGDTVSKKKV